MAAKLLRALLGLFVIAALGYVLPQAATIAGIDTHWIDSTVRTRGWAGEGLFFAVATLLLAVGTPRQLISFLGGYAFGAVWGSAVALFATLLACVLSFYYARWLGRERVQARAGVRWRQLDAILRNHPWSMTLFVRLLPIGNNLLTNLVAGVTRVPAPPFFLGSLLGYLPQTVVFAVVGSGVALRDGTETLVGVALFIVSGAIGIGLYYRLRNVSASQTPIA